MKSLPGLRRNILPAHGLVMIVGAPAAASGSRPAADPYPGIRRRKVRERDPESRRTSALSRSNARASSRSTKSRAPARRLQLLIPAMLPRNSPRRAAARSASAFGVELAQGRTAHRGAPTHRPRLARGGSTRPAALSVAQDRGRHAGPQAAFGPSSVGGHKPVPACSAPPVPRSAGRDRASPFQACTAHSLRERLDRPQEGAATSRRGRTCSDAKCRKIAPSSSSRPARRSCSMGRPRRPTCRLRRPGRRSERRTPSPGSLELVLEPRRNARRRAVPA